MKNLRAPWGLYLAAAACLIPCPSWTQSSPEYFVPGISRIFDGARTGFPAVRAVPLRQDAPPPAPQAPPPPIITDELWTQITGEWEKGLKEFKTSEKHAAYAKRHPLVFWSKEPSSIMPERAFASWNEDGVYVNRSMLGRFAEDLKRKGVGPQELARRTALATLPAIVHEIRHGMSFELMEEECGFGVICAGVPEELVAFIDTVLMIDEMAARMPELALEEMEPYKGWLEALDRSAGGLENWVRGAYWGALRGVENQTEVIARMRNTKEEESRTLDQIRSLLELSKNAENAEKAEETRKALARLPLESEQKLIVDRVGNVISVLESSANFKSWQEFYVRRLAEAEPLLERLRRDRSLERTLGQTERFLQAGNPFDARIAFQQFAEGYLAISQDERGRWMDRFQAAAPKILPRLIEHALANLETLFAGDVRTLEGVTRLVGKDPVKELKAVYPLAAAAALGLARQMAQDRPEGWKDVFEQCLSDARDLGAKAGLDLTREIEALRGLVAGNKEFSRAFGDLEGPAEAWVFL